MLAAPAREAISNPQNEVLFSASSVWEVALKQAVGRLKVRHDFVEALVARRFAPLAITVDHAVAAADLPLHHTDPFDRMLIAQAQLESLTIVTRDRRFTAYDVALLPA